MLSLNKREEKYIKLLFKISSLTFTNILNILLVKKYMVLSIQLAIYELKN